MDSLRVDTTYGTALYEAAEDAQIIDAVLEDLNSLSSVFKENPALKKLFLTPTVSGDDKKAVAKKLFAGSLSQLTLNFLQVLIDKRRLGAWDGIVKQYNNLMDEKDGTTKGIVYSVVQLSKESIIKLEEETGKSLSKKIKLENRIDNTLIGGVVVYVDGKLIDVSIKRRLENLKQAMLR